MAIALYGYRNSMGAISAENVRRAMLSRPAIQHGRIEPPNTKRKAARLLNTVETLLALHDLLKNAELFSITSGNGEASADRPRYF
jgi:hypothetical protein